MNNVLCFPFIFRGALDVGATKITKEMQIACVEALAELAMEEAPDTVVAAYGGADLKFGPEYLIPKPFDPRLILKLAPATARAAMDSGVATRPIADLEAYRDQLMHYVSESVMLMRPVFERARGNPQRLVYAEGEDPRVLRTIQSVLDEELAVPVVIGNRDTVRGLITRLGLRMRAGEDLEIIDPATDADCQAVLAGTDAQRSAATVNTLIAAHMVARGRAQGVICGAVGHYHEHLQHIIRALGVSPGAGQPAAMNIVMLKKGVFFIADTAVTPDPDAAQIAEITLLAAEGMRRFGITPKAALLSHTNNVEGKPLAVSKMNDALKLIRAAAPDLEIDGVMRADSALMESLRNTIRPASPLSGSANLLIMPNLDAAKIAYDLLKMLGDGTTIGPLLLGLRQPAHIMTSSSTVRRLLNASALVAVDAWKEQQSQPGQAIPAVQA